MSRFSSCRTASVAPIRNTLSECSEPEPACRIDAAHGYSKAIEFENNLLRAAGCSGDRPPSGDRSPAHDCTPLPISSSPVTVVPILVTRSLRATTNLMPRFERSLLRVSCGIHCYSVETEYSGSHKFSQRSTSQRKLSELASSRLSASPITVLSLRRTATSFASPFLLAVDLALGRRSKGFSGRKAPAVFPARFTEASATLRWLNLKPDGACRAFLTLLLERLACGASLSRLSST